MDIQRRGEWAKKSCDLHSHCPIAATAHFFVRGLPDSVWVVAAGCSGCTILVFTVHAGDDAEAVATKKARALQLEDWGGGDKKFDKSDPRHPGGMTYWAEEITVGRTPGMTWNLRSIGCTCGKCEGRTTSCPYPVHPECVCGECRHVPRPSCV